jgi:hypothetical protein
LNLLDRLEDEMSLEMIVALIAASASIACAIISIFASRDAQKAAARAQEASRRMEQLRLQATKVGQELIDTKEPRVSQFLKKGRQNSGNS